jgi:hypothetical protein
MTGLVQQLQQLPGDYSPALTLYTASLRISGLAADFTQRNRTPATFVGSNRSIFLWPIAVPRHSSCH